jgi:CHAD domain-containing protein
LRAAVILHHEASLPLGACGDRGRGIELARRAVAAAKRRFACIDIEATTPGALRRRLRNAYRRARRAWREARAVRGAEALHVLRIRVKRLLDQMRLVRAFGARPLGGERRRLSRLDDMLGRSRDCGALAHVLRGVPPAEAPLGDGYGLRARLEVIAAAQTAAALRLGAAVFRRRSRLWVERMLGPERTRR